MRRLIRSIAFVLTLVAAFAASSTGLFALGSAIHSERLSMNLTMMIFGLPRPLQRLRAHSLNPDTFTIAFMGDSTVIAYPEGQTIHERLESVLIPQWLGPGRISVESLSSLGMTPAGFFLIQDKITEARPDVAIVTANLTLIRDSLPPNLHRPELAGWVRSHRLYDALIGLGLHKFGVTADRLFLYKSIVSAGWAGIWMAQLAGQAHLGHLREVVEEAVAEKTGWTAQQDHTRQRDLRRGTESLLPRTPPRLTRIGAQRMVGEPMAGIDADQWAIRILRAILEEFARTGRATVLYVPPINIDHLKSVGVYDEAGLAKSLATLERIAYETDAEFADLHDLLPDAAFRDTGAHLTYAPGYDGPTIVAEALAPYVMIQTRAVAQNR